MKSRRRIFSKKDKRQMLPDTSSINALTSNEIKEEKSAVTGIADPMEAPQNSHACEAIPNKTKHETLIHNKVIKLVYKYAEEAILKGIAVGSKAFRNYLKNRINLKDSSEEIIETAINSTDYSQLKERYIKDGKVIAKESQKYTLTLHAKERISKPDPDNVTHLFEKYKAQAEKKGIRNHKGILSYLKDKIQPRDIPIEIVLDAIDNGRCEILTGKKEKYSKDGITIVTSRRDHSIITVYQNNTNNNPHTFHKTVPSSNITSSVPAEDKQEECNIEGHSFIKRSD